ncbi:MAG: ABC transporter ATP-binding protein [Egibacteraceae bacterium]
MTAVSLRAVSVAYGSIAAVRGIDLDVLQGEWVGLIGPNGAGKSSLLRAVAGLVASTGTIWLGDVHSATLDRRSVARRIASVPQQPVIPESMTVAEYVLLGRTPHIGLFGAEGRLDLEVVAAVLDRLSLTAFAGRRLGTLSGGELQRVVLARALAQQAPLLLLDEPTGALDIGQQQRVLELVAELRADEGLTVLSAMHDLTLAGQFADRLLLLVDGAAVACGTPEAVLTDAHLRRWFGADVIIRRDPEAGLAVLPVRRSVPGQPQADAG